MAVVFRYQFSNYKNDPQFKETLEVYKPKWSALMRYINSISRTRETYDRLGRVREQLDRDFELDDVLDAVDQVDSTATRLFMDVQVLFNRVPYDFRTFMIAVVGCDGTHVAQHRSETHA